MIVVGVDPGGKSTGIAVIQYPDSLRYGTAAGVDVDSLKLVASTTIHRADDGPLTNVPPAYLRYVNSAILDAVATLPPAGPDDWHRPRADLIAVEGVRRPSTRVRGQVNITDPSGIIATAVVLGAITGRAWTVPAVVVPPGGNGHALPLNRYPAPLATSGKGQDKRRHERSAFDVALRAAQTPAALIRNGHTP